MVNQAKNLLQALGPIKLGIAAVLVGLTVAGLYLLMTWTGPQSWQTLYSRLDSQDAGQIIEKLKEQKTPYQLADGGTTIRVPGERLYDIRLVLASQGLPRGGGVGFEVFDSTKLGMTEFVQNINYQRALQGELSRTINGFAEVESSRVHIVMPRQSLFINEEDAASASVIINLRPGRTMGKEQVQGIVHLVSSSVPRLRPDKVTVVDNSGHVLSGTQDAGGMEQLNAAQLEFQAKVEKNLESRVRTMLEKVLGQDKAIVRAACLLDFVRQEKTEEKYLADNQVLRSEQSLSEISNAAEKGAAGVPGLASNLTENATGTSPGATGSGKSYQKQDKTANYEIGKVTSHQIVPVGRIMKLSVAVIVDGTYRPKPGNEKEKKKKESEELEYLPRSDQEMKRIESIVKGAINFDDQRGDRVEVANIPFVLSKTEIEEQILAGSGGWLATVSRHAGLLKHAAVAGFMVLAFLFVVRPMVRWLTAVSMDEFKMMQQLPRSIAELENQYGVTGRSAAAARLSYTDQAAQIIASDRKSTVALMQGWLKET